MSNVVQLTKSMKAHPIADLFPLMDGAEFNALVDSMRTNGQLDPIIVQDGVIIDGRNRARACQVLGIEPRIAHLPAGVTVEEYIVTANLPRRRLAVSQRAIVAARLVGTNPRLKLDDIAAMFEIGRATISEARLVIAEGSEEQIAACVAGRLSVNAVARVIRGSRSVGAQSPSRPVARSREERAENQRFVAEIWSRVSAALDQLTGLPLPADVAKIVKVHPQRRRVVDAKLLRALQWLEEFKDAYISEDAAA